MTRSREDRDLLQPPFPYLLSTGKRKKRRLAPLPFCERKENRDFTNALIATQKRKGKGSFVGYGQKKGMDVLDGGESGIKDKVALWDMP